MNKHIAAVLGGGICWGFMGLFTRQLSGFGIGAPGAILIRCGIAALAFGLLMLFSDPRRFRVRLRDAWCFLGSGLLSLLFFTFCYFNAIRVMSLSAAAILLYTAPAIVMLLSALFFRERITLRKGIAVAIAFGGCCLVSGVAGGVSLTTEGLLYGLGSGVGYALYTVFSRCALRRGYHSTTVNFYSCLLAGLGALALWGAGDTVSIAVSSWSALLWCVATGVVSCFVPYLLYTYSLTGLENSKASVLASVEPVVASLLGVFCYRETMTLPMLAGIAMVLGAVVLLSLSPGKNPPEDATV